MYANVTESAMLGLTATARGLCMGGHFFLRRSPQEFRNGPWFHRCAHTLAHAPAPGR